MEYIEMTGKVLLKMVDMTGMSIDELQRAGVEDDTLVRVTRLGDLEMRKTHKWDVIGGLLGDYERKVKQETGLDWA